MLIKSNLPILFGRFKLLNDPSKENSAIAGCRTMFLKNIIFYFVENLIKYVFWSFLWTNSFLGKKTKNRKLFINKFHINRNRTIFTPFKSRNLTVSMLKNVKQFNKKVCC